MSEDLWSAYARTRVEFLDCDDVRWAIEPAGDRRQGWPDLGGPAFLAGVEVAWVLTAHNPFSDPLPPAANAWRQRACAAAVAAAGYPWRPALGRGLDGAWEEESMLVAGSAQPVIAELARRFHQNAVYRWTPQEWSIIGVHMTGSRHLRWRGSRLS